MASITSIKYTDTSGTEQTISSSAYALSTYGESRTVSRRPAETTGPPQDIPDAVRIRYVTGYAATGAGAEYAALPKAVRPGPADAHQPDLPRNVFTPAEREAMETARDSC